MGQRVGKEVERTVKGGKKKGRSKRKREHTKGKKKGREVKTGKHKGRKRSGESRGRDGENKRKKWRKKMMQED